MKKSFLVFWILYGFLLPHRMLAIDAAFATNGVIVAVPVQMPVVGVIPSTKQTVLNLFAADPATRASCGYYECKPFDRSTVATNQYVASTAWSIQGFYAVQSAVISNRVPRITLSRTKLASLAKSQGWTESFMAFINGDPVIAVRWYSDEKLVAGSAEMRPFIEGFAALVGVSYAQAIVLLEGCRE